jgi:hypothetical protein
MWLKLVGNPLGMGLQNSMAAIQLPFRSQLISELSVFR